MSLCLGIEPETEHIEFVLTPKKHTKHLKLHTTGVYDSKFPKVSAKNNVKQLTESMGQEVIEIGAPIKELPMGLEEEPSAEEEPDDDEKGSLKATANTASPATKKDIKKTTAAILKKDVKKLEKMEALNSDEDEARIEKELSEIYKDTADYKSDSAEEKEVVKETEPPTTFKQETEEEFSVEESDTELPIGRQRGNFKFQPDATDPASIERFRTSIDQVSCQNKQKLKANVTPETREAEQNNAFGVISNGILLITAILSYVFICS